VQKALAAHKPGDIDWVTFVGSGEPLLHASLGRLIREVKSLTNLPVAVITNGSLFYLPDVRAELTTPDAVMPSLDASTAKLYRRINRPHPDATFERLSSGLKAFRQEYVGDLWVEVMLIRGLNDTEDALRDIAATLRQIHPDEVHINLPTRPPAETWVTPPDDEGLMRATAILGDIAHVVQPIDGTFDLSGCNSLVEAVVAIITRHPMQQEELERTLAHHRPGHVKKVLAELEASGKAQVVERYGARFWSAAPSYYPLERAPTRRTWEDSR
jgi:wyosine [tRNA(Phe)-imidazoG37] synthetase (radical SAM superfamily)